MNYILVYRVDENSIESLKDVGDDPCFENEPTWGICRPNIRNRTNLQPGSVLVFVANIEDNYFVRGCLKVSEKIDIISALERFPQRQNVIITDEKPKLLNPEELEDRPKKPRKKKNYPDFLRKLVHKGKIYYQRPKDDHGLYNWKCSRIFYCKKATLKKCLEQGKCLKETNNFKLKLNYIVGNKAESYDWYKLKIKWQDVVIALGFPEIKRIYLSEKVFKHPEIEISTDKVLKLIDYVSKKTKEQIATSSKS